jgi:methyl-accepting chemotaxis protein
MKKKYPSLKSLISVLILNDFAINTVSGIGAGFILFIAGLIDVSEVWKFFEYGIVVISPFYLLHLYRIKKRIQALYLNEDEYVTTDMQKIVSTLKKLIFFPYKTAFILALIWSVGVVFTTFFVIYVVHSDGYSSFFAIFLLLGIVPFVWVVEYIVVKRSIIKLLKRYIELLPEKYYAEIRGKGKSIVDNWTYAVSYLVFYCIFVMMALNFGLYKKVMNKNLTEIATGTIENVQDDISAMLFTDLSKEEMSTYLKSLPLIENATLSVKLNDSNEILGSGIVTKKNAEDILVKKEIKDKNYTVYCYIPANYMQIYNSFLKKSVFFFAFLQIIIFVIVVFQIGREFKNEVKMVLRSTMKVADGDLTRGEIIFAQDELGDLYGAVLTVKSNTKAIISKISSYTKNVSEVIQGVQDASDFLLKVAAHQDEMVMEAIESINYIDDFTEKLKNSTETLANESEIASATVTQFAVTIAQVKDSMHKLLRMAESSSSAIVEMNSSIAEISNNLSSLKVFGEEMDETIVTLKEISDSLREFLSSMQLIIEESVAKNSFSKAGVEQVLEVLNEATNIFGKLSKENIDNSYKLEEILNIINLIDDYLDQTDVLALNAAIIAAQTDMKDRGIGVIADEIKDISEKINSAAGKISSITTEAVLKIKEQEELSSFTNKKISSATAKMESKFENSKELSLLLGKGKTQVAEALSKIKEHDIHTRNLLERYKLFLNQISSIFGAIEEQKKNSNELARISTEIKDMAEIVSNATREQTAGANQIATSSERINEFASNTRESVGKLKDSLQKVLYLTNELNTNTFLTNSRAKELNNVVDTVSNEMKHLKEEVRRFQL